MHNVLKSRAEQSQPRASYYLSNDKHLVGYYTSTNGRIRLLSETKPAIVTHYHEKDIPSATESNICIPNGLNYQYYEEDSKSYLDNGFVPTEEMQFECTYKLPQEAKALQKFIFRSGSAPDGEAPDNVIASQDACSTIMTLEEYKELATIPLGHQVQWLNILLQLAMPNVDFKKLETALVVLQCIYQAEPQSHNKNPLRESHYLLQSNKFTATIMTNLNTVLNRVKENWESVNALSAFIAIAARVLSLNQSARETCLESLHTTRCIAGEWLSELKEKAYMAMNNHVDRIHFEAKSIDVALVYISTFDVDEQHLAAIMRSSDAHFILWASIVVQEGENSPAMNEPNVARLRFRFKRLLYRSYAILSHNGMALDDAIQKVWSGYSCSNSGWSVLAEHWMTTKTAAAAHVHYNLLSGELLVHGLPLDHPPAEYQKSPLFRTLFGNATVEVMPASHPGFRFSAKRSFGGCAVNIAMRSGDLIVQAMIGRHTYETVPSDLLQNKYPRHFSRDYILWYSTVHKHVIFLPKEDPWNFDHSSKWTLSKLEATSEWELSRDGIRVVGTASATATILASLLQPLADTLDMHCLLQPGVNKLHVEIPLLHLGFKLKRGSDLLHSREHRSMSVDENQSLGTLIGFQNKIILKNHQTGDRVLLILESALQYWKDDSHVQVQVRDRAKSRVHVIGVDGLLHRLTDNHDLSSKLFLAYLHALTSYCLPDPATLHTGTEQALTMLRSNAVRSFSQLSQANVKILDKIAQLTPGRRFYPSHLRTMQSVKWDQNLPFLSQHDDFSLVVSGLLRQSEASKLFYPEMNIQIVHRNDIDEHLRARASLRSSIFQVSGFGAENHDSCHDEIYEPRDQGLHSQRATNVATLSALLCRAGEAKHWKAAQPSSLWSLVSDQEIIRGAQTKFDVSRFRFDAPLLGNDVIGTILADLPALHQLFKNAGTLERYRFSLMVWLCTMSFAGDAWMEELQLLVMCVKSRRLALVQVPNSVSFRANQGCSFKDINIKRLLDQNVRRPNESPEWNAARQSNEKRADYDRRRKLAWTRAKDTIVERTSSVLQLTS